ncbi:MAG: D-alanine--D-alanine ligase [Ruminococcus sp.]|nr:D-alanine--D-alanine ligase [Ruminococcus sp.]
MAKLKAAVIFGGTSREHKLSLASAAEVISSIPEDKYEVICIGITRKGRWLCYPGDVSDIATGEWEQNPDCTSAILSPDPLHRGIVLIENGEATVRKIDVVFPVLMGKHGADGDIQGLLDLSGIPYVGCGLLSSASCMDKSHIHMVMDNYNIPTADWRLIKQREINDIDERCREISEEMGFPLSVKPAQSGTSAGTGRADNYEELVSAVKIAFLNDNKVVIEKVVEGTKLEVAVYGTDFPSASQVGEIIGDFKEYDPNEVHQNTDEYFRIPADISEELSKKVRQTAVLAYKAMNCKSFARISFILADDGNLILSKINTAPGLRSDSVFPMLMKNTGLSLEDIVDNLLEQAIDNADKVY